MKPVRQSDGIDGAVQCLTARDTRSASGGDVLHGAAGDWIMQYAPGDYGVVQAARFAKVYRLAD